MPLYDFLTAEVPQAPVCLVAVGAQKYEAPAAVLVVPVQAVDVVAPPGKLRIAEPPAAVLQAVLAVAQAVVPAVVQAVVLPVVLLVELLAPAV